MNHFLKIIPTALITLILLLSCQTKNTEEIDPQTDDTTEAKIVSVTFTGSPNNYNFQVGVLSPDKGCNQYADWWEVISESGDLIYRRILSHSHVDQQPFVRSGGGVNITADQIVIVRAHMNVAGYGVQVFKGSINAGFQTFDTVIDFAKGLETQEPLPHSCAF